MQQTWRMITRSNDAHTERLLAAHEPTSVVAADRFRRGYIDKHLRTGGRWYLMPHTTLIYHGPGGFFVPLGLADSITTPRRRPSLPPRVAPR